MCLFLIGFKQGDFSLKFLNFLRRTIIKIIFRLSLAAPHRNKIAPNLINLALQHRNLMPKMLPQIDHISLAIKLILTPFPLSLTNIVLVFIQLSYPILKFCYTVQGRCYVIDCYCYILVHLGEFLHVLLLGDAFDV